VTPSAARAAATARRRLPRVYVRVECDGTTQKGKKKRQGDGQIRGSR
jgi:hypothetical protein